MFKSKRLNQAAQDDRRIKQSLSNNNPVKEKITDYFSYLSVLGGVLLIVTIIADVLSRVLFKSGIIWSSSLATLLIVVIGYSCVAACYKEGMLISSDFIVRHFGDRARFAIEILSILLGFTCCIFLLFLTTTDTIESYFSGETVPAIPMPVWPWKIVLNIGILLLAVEMISVLLRIIRSGRFK